MKTYTVDENGFYGDYGGAFIPEMLFRNVREIRKNYKEILFSESFRKEYTALLTDFVGRPSPLFYASRLSAEYRAEIYLKREDLNHTGAHKINNTMGQILLAKSLGKTRIIAETGAGQHGVATATACAFANMECVIYMGEIDMMRQKPNVERMRLLGAKVIPAKSGSKTLKDATNEAIRDWISHPEGTYYLIGSVVGPHPYPDLVARLQAVISQEMKEQLKIKTGRDYPDKIIACVGGGSNAIGAFYHFLENKNVKLYGIEAAGKGVNTTKTAASIALGKKGVIHGSMTYLMQNEDGQIIEPYSISAGLDYPGVGPVHAYLNDTKRVRFLSVTDREALEAGIKLARTEGIIPALESAHAIAALKYIPIEKNETLVINLSGRGDKDMATYKKFIR